MAEINFSKHELVITQHKNIETYELVLKDKETLQYSKMFYVCLCYSTNLFNTVMTISGDFGYYIFGQSLPLKGEISFPYFLEKLKLETVQNLKDDWDQDYYLEYLREVENELSENLEHYSQTLIENLETRLEELKKIDNQFDFNCYIWNMNADEREHLFGENPSSIGRPLNTRIEIIYNAFNEIKKRLNRD